MQDRLVFFKEFFRSFQTTGSMTPSSRWAAKALTDPLRCKACTKNILEIGPGTGSVTDRILKDMIPGDRFTICEINPRFMKLLREKLSENPDYHKHSDRVSFFEGSIIDLPEEQKFDVIICAIPFTNMDVSFVREIFAKLERLSADEASLSFFEYFGLRDLNKIAAPAERKKRLEAVDSFVAEFAGRYDTSQKVVWLNFLPILIRTIRMNHGI